jgi:large conductance mechanosensitive channel
MCNIEVLIYLKIVEMRFVKEFKDFAVKGNVVDLAVGVIVGGAFGKIVNSLIEDVITPLLLKPALEKAHLTKLEELTVMGAVKYGNFISSVINFVIVAFILFLIIKGVNKMNAIAEEEKNEPIAPEPSNQEKLLMEIRDALKK